MSKREKCSGSDHLHAQDEEFNALMEEFNRAQDEADLNFAPILAEAERGWADIEWPEATLIRINVDKWQRSPLVQEETVPDQTRTPQPFVLDEGTFLNMVDSLDLSTSARDHVRNEAATILNYIKTHSLHHYSNHLSPTSNHASYVALLRYLFSPLKLYWFVHAWREGYRLIPQDNNIEGWQLWFADPQVLPPLAWEGLVQAKHVLQSWRRNVLRLTE